MTNKIKIADLPEFDMVNILKSKRISLPILISYLKKAMRQSLLMYLVLLLEQKAWQIVHKKSGITREALYKALRPNAHPRFDTVNKVMHAMGVKLHASV